MNLTKPRIICWYSHGAASLVAAKLAIDNAPLLHPSYEVLVVCIFIKDELHEPERIALVEKYLGQKIIFLSDDKYGASVDEVIRKIRYMSGVYGASCTKELKKAVRLKYQRDSDIHVFGMDVNEQSRIDGLIDTEPTLNVWAPLIDAKLSKQDCFKIMNREGIPLPKMYQLGYHNNNCVGCLKAGGAGYWNKIRTDFPDVFEKRAEQERLLNVAMVSMSRDKFRRDHPVEFSKMVTEWEDRFKTSIRKGKEYHTQLIPLRYLPETAGNHRDLDIGDCGIICEMK